MSSVGAVRVACQVSEELSRARGSDVRVVIVIAEEYFLCTIERVAKRLLELLM